LRANREHRLARKAAYVARLLAFTFNEQKRARTFPVDVRLERRVAAGLQSRLACRKVEHDQLAVLDAAFMQPVLRLLSVFFEAARHQPADLPRRRMQWGRMEKEFEVVFAVVVLVFSGIDAKHAVDVHTAALKHVVMHDIPLEEPRLRNDLQRNVNAVAA
jgi:hypothetical protein